MVEASLSIVQRPVNDTSPVDFERSASARFTPFDGANGREPPFEGDPPPAPLSGLDPPASGPSGLPVPSDVLLHAARETRTIARPE